MKLRAIATLILATGCSTLEAKPAYVTGEWGGPHVGVAFNGGLADVQFDCASASIDALIFPAKDGSFEARGTYREGAPGPVRVGQVFRAQPATFSGNVMKDVMTLDVRLEDGTMVGPFSLSRGAHPQITRCL